MTARARWWAAVTGAGLAVVIAGTCGLLLTRHGTPAPRPAPAASVATQPAFPAPTAPIVAARPRSLLWSPGPRR